MENLLLFTAFSFLWIWTIPFTFFILVNWKIYQEPLLLDQFQLCLLLTVQFFLLLFRNAMNIQPFGEMIQTVRLIDYYYLVMLVDELAVFLSAVSGLLVFKIFVFQNLHHNLIARWSVRIYYFTLYLMLFVTGFNAVWIFFVQNPLPFLRVSVFSFKTFYCFAGILLLFYDLFFEDYHEHIVRRYPFLIYSVFLMQIISVFLFFIFKNRFYFMNADMISLILILIHGFLISFRLKKQSQRITDLIINERNAIIEMQEKILHIFENRYDSPLTGCLKEILSDIVSLTGADGGALYLYHQTTRHYQMKSLKGLMIPDKHVENGFDLIQQKEAFEKSLMEEKIYKGAGTIGSIIAGNEAVWIKNTANRQEYSAPLKKFCEVVSFIGLPLIHRKGYFGWINLIRTKKPFINSDYNLALSLSGYASYLLQQTALMQKRHEELNIEYQKKIEKESGKFEAEEMKHYTHLNWLRKIGRFLKQQNAVHFERSYPVQKSSGQTLYFMAGVKINDNAYRQKTLLDLDHFFKTVSFFQVRPLQIYSAFQKMSSEDKNIIGIQFNLCLLFDSDKDIIWGVVGNIPVYVIHRQDRSIKKVIADPGKEISLKLKGNIYILVLTENQKHNILKELKKIVLSGTDKLNADLIYGVLNAKYLNELKPNEWLWIIQK